MAKNPAAVRPAFLFNCLGQDFTNKGKEFWIGHENHQQMYTASLPGMDIYITSDVGTKVLVEIPAMGITIGTFEVKARQITVVPEITHDAFLNQEGTSNKGIHILAEDPVVVYAHIYTALATGSNLCLPVSTIGREYYPANFIQVVQPGLYEREFIQLLFCGGDRG